MNLLGDEPSTYTSSIIFVIKIWTSAMKINHSIDMLNQWGTEAEPKTTGFGTRNL